MLKLPVKELVVFGLISNRGMVVVAAALGLVSQTGLFNRDFGGWFERQIESGSGIPDPGIGDKLFLIPLFVLAAIVVLLVLMRVLSVTWAIFKLYGFTLTRRGDDLRTVYGLLTRVSATIPRRRIQLLSMRVSRLHRMLRRASVQVETAGGSGGGEGSDEVQGPITERLWLAPLIRRDRVPGLLSEVLPDLDTGDVDWQPISPRARRRILRKGLVLLTLLGAVSFAAFGAWGLVWLPLGVWLLWNHARRWVATAAYALTDDSVIFRSGWWGQSTTVVRFGKIQVLELSETPFDRRNRMASVKVDTAGASRVGHRIAIPYLEADIARRVLARLDAEASQTAFSW